MTDRERPEAPREIPPVGDDELPTTRIAKSRIADIARARLALLARIEETVELTVDAMPNVDVTLDVLPDDLRAQPLPFQPPPEDAIERTTDVAPDALFSPDVPFVRRPPPVDAVVDCAVPGGVETVVVPEPDPERFGRIVAELERGVTSLRDAFDDELIEARAHLGSALGRGGVGALLQELERGIDDATSAMDDDIADAMRFLRMRRKESPKLRAVTRDDSDAPPARALRKDAP